MASNLSLPVPALIINQNSSILDILINNILVDLGYPQELIAISSNLLEVNQYIERHLPNFIFYNVQTEADIAFINQIKASQPSAYIVTIHPPEHLQEVISALHAGADAYLLQNTPANELFEQIKVILRGGAVLHSPVAQHLLHTRFQSSSQSNTQQALSPAEYQILQHTAQSISIPQTASALKLSDYQVDVLIKNILRKSI